MGLKYYFYYCHYFVDNLKKEQAEIAKIEEEQSYRKQLYSMDNFTVRPYKPREWTSNDTIQIPLECKIALEDLRLKKTLKKLTTILDNIPQKVQKLPEKPDTYTEAETTPVYPVGPSGYNSTAPHDGMHITESDDKLFPETHIEIQKEIKETRKVYLNNTWKITDEVGSTDFEEEYKNIEDIDWLTFISTNVNY